MARILTDSRDGQPNTIPPEGTQRKPERCFERISHDPAIPILTSNRKEWVMKMSLLTTKQCRAILLLAIAWGSIPWLLSCVYIPIALATPLGSTQEAARSGARRFAGRSPAEFLINKLGRRVEDARRWWQSSSSTSSE